MIVRHGVHAPIEDAANEMLRISMASITKHSDKADILTPWKEQSRRSREVHVPSGTPDASLRKGTFGKAANLRDSHLNSVDGVRPAKSRGHGPDWDSE